VQFCTLPVLLKEFSSFGLLLMHAVFFFGNQHFCRIVARQSKRIDWKGHLWTRTRKVDFLFESWLLSRADRQNTSCCKQYHWTGSTQTGPFKFQWFHWCWKRKEGIKKWETGYENKNEKARLIKLRLQTWKTNW